MYYMLKICTRHTLKKLYELYFHVIQVAQCFQHILHIVSMHFLILKQHKPFYPTKFKMFVDLWMPFGMFWYAF